MSLPDIERTDDPDLKAMAEAYARGSSKQMAWGDPEEVAIYYAFIAGYNTAKRATQAG